MPRYTAEQFIKAIPGSGGIITTIAERVGCDWHTAKKFIEKHPTVEQAWESERQKITDKAQHNVIKAISKDEDLPTSKWWLKVKSPEFTPRHKLEHSFDVRRFWAELERIDPDLAARIKEQLGKDTG